MPVAKAQTVPVAFNVLEGQTVDEPEHTASFSQTPLAALQTVPLGFKLSAGQAPEEPVQVTVLSQAPAEVWQTVVSGITISVGQSLCVPSHDSDTSHPPDIAGRQILAMGAPV